MKNIFRKKKIAKAPRFNDQEFGSGEPIVITNQFLIIRTRGKEHHHHHRHRHHRRLLFIRFEIAIKGVRVRDKNIIV